MTTYIQMGSLNSNMAEKQPPRLLQAAVAFPKFWGLFFEKQIRQMFYLKYQIQPPRPLVSRAIALLLNFQL